MYGVQFHKYMVSSKQSAVTSSFINLFNLLLSDDCPVYRAGGPWLITDMRRGETIFDIDPHLQVRLY